MCERKEIETYMEITENKFQGFKKIKNYNFMSAGLPLYEALSIWGGNRGQNQSFSGNKNFVLWSGLLSILTRGSNNMGSN